MSKSSTAAKTKQELPPEEPTIDPRGLPCPFCGAAATIMGWHGGGPERTLISCEDDEGKTCDAAPSVLGETVTEAIEKWNRRA